MVPLGLAALVVGVQEVLKHHGMTLLPFPTHINLWFFMHLPPASPSNNGHMPQSEANHHFGA